EGESVRPSLQVACVLHGHQPPGVGGEAVATAIDTVYMSLLERLEGAAGLRLNLHVSGAILAFASEHRPEFLQRMRSLVKEDRLELLGGAFHDPVLPSIPARDALGQLVYASNFLAEHCGGTPHGAWLSLRAWDASVVAPLDDAGLSYSLVDSAAFVDAGLEPWEVHGYFTTERHGKSVALFPIDEVLSQVVLEEGAGGLAAALDRLALRPQPPSLLVLALGVEALWASEQQDALFLCLEDNDHWMKTNLLGNFWEAESSSGRVYLGQSAWPRIRNWCRPVSAESDDLSKGSEDGTVLWDNVLVRYEESNRLHKRMLRVSARIDQLRQVLARQKRKGKNISGARKLLEKACGTLWRAQGHHTYWHGAELNLGIYDPVLRCAALRDLMAAERAVDRVLAGREPPPWEELIADHDGDGVDEVLVRSEHLRAIIDPARGGGLSELDLRPMGIALLSALDPVAEPYHSTPAGTEVQLVFEEGEAETPAAREEEGRLDAFPALARLAVGSMRRGAFLDHFLGPETTLASFARRQFRELGNFADGSYDLISPSGRSVDGELAVGRSGVVKDGETSALFRVEKTYRFDLEHPRMTLEHSISNRSRDPASSWFGLEWTFGLPLGHAGGVSLKTQGESGEQVFRLTDGPAEISDVSWLEWEDRESGLAIVLELDRPHGVWWLPVQTIARGPEGWREDIQGNTFLFHGPAEIWGHEERRFQLRIGFLTD
ncbi:MAG: alpha-amylase/4-alpha-glucanotransferase domain-containing protein, partial [Myxococcota bacterium]|nr:alpha-amylase/4-alpha-glucanotransferase domain-containing protein [Myxococcota bacterium]